MDVPKEEVVKKIHVVKGCLLDNLPTAYTVDHEDSKKAVANTLLEIDVSVVYPRLGLSMTTPEKSESAFHGIIGGPDMAVACTLSDLTVVVPTWVVGGPALVLSVNILGCLSLIIVEYAWADSEGKTDTTSDGGVADTGSELITSDTMAELLTTPCLGVTIVDTPEEATGLASADEIPANSESK